MRFCWPGCVFCKFCGQRWLYDCDVFFFCLCFFLFLNNHYRKRLLLFFCHLYKTCPIVDVIWVDSGNLGNRGWTAGRSVPQTDSVCSLPRRSRVGWFLLRRSFRRRISRKRLRMLACRKGCRAPVVCRQTSRTSRRSLGVGRVCRHLKWPVGASLLSVPLWGGQSWSLLWALRASWSLLRQCRLWFPGCKSTRDLWGLWRNSFMWEMWKVKRGFKQLTGEQPCFQQVFNPAGCSGDSISFAVVQQEAVCAQILWTDQWCDDKLGEVKNAHDASVPEYMLY